MKLDHAEVARVLTDWLGQQRWYAGKSRIGTVTARLLTTLTDDPAPVQLWLADIAYTDGGLARYQIPLVLRTESHDQLEHALVGSVVDEETGKAIDLYDALHDKDVTGLWLRGIADETRTGPVRFVRSTDPGDIPVGAPSLAMAAQQSNTSLVFGDAAIMKVFRRIEAGLNPDIEIHEALAPLGARHVARIFGHVSAEIDDEQYSLAMIQEFMTTASDGWHLATTSVRDLMAEADLHAEEAGGDFAAEAYRLGTSTAEVHVDLAAAFGTTELTKSDLLARTEQMNARLDAALREVPVLEDLADGLRERYAALADAGAIPAQRVHGDLHLGQVLRTVHRWVFLDFEGEPAKTIAERREFDSPLRDVAGMLRSFDYAARHQLVDISATSQAEFRAVEWSRRNRDAFCAGYAEASELDPAEWTRLLTAFEADKAVYEAVYETRSRPNWLAIPMASLQRLSGAEV